MTRAIFVKSARKDNQVAKKGESYYWWKFRFGGKHFSKTAPKPSQLINSPFLSQIALYEEDINSWDPSSFEDLRDLVSDMASQLQDLGSEQQDKLDNMPNGLQQGPTGELLQSRIDGCEEWASELEGINAEDPEQDKDAGETDDDFKTRVDEELESALSEVQSASYNGE